MSLMHCEISKMRGLKMKPETTHLHTLVTEYVFDQADDNRPSWAESYTGPKRWLIVDKCTGCEYKSTRDVTTEPPPKKKGQL